MKRIISFVLSLVMIISMIPIGAFATVVEDESIDETTAVTEASEEQTEAPETQAPSEETEVPAETAAEEPSAPSEETASEPAVTEEAVAETVAEETEEIYEEISETIVTTQELPESSELYDAYLERLFYGNDVAYLGESAREQLTALEQEFYDVLKPEILRIAAGERTSTVITITRAQMVAWDTDVTLVYNTTSAQTAHDSFTAQFSQTNIINALMHDCPYEMYWYDKTVGTIFSSTSSISGSNATISSIYFKFRVAGDMQPAGYDALNPTIDTSSASTAQAAAKTAQNIVDAYSAYSDYEKLVAYKDKICALVSYNDEAAKNSTYTTDADPWQLIYVFDGDTDTNVVCEGYSKAFQYLCDLSSFRGDVSCYTVTGKLAGGGHMWNIVTIDGQNYLADVTNSDTGTAGARGGMFLAGSKGSVSGGYTFLGYAFTYSDNTLALWGENVLTLASSDYVPGESSEEDAAGSDSAASMTQDELEAAIAEAVASGSYGYVLQTSVTLERNLEVDVLSIAEGGHLIVPEGVKLTVHDSLYVEIGGTLDVLGTYELTNENGWSVTVNTTYQRGKSGTINGVADADIVMNCGVYSQEDMEDVLQAVQNSYGRNYIFIQTDVSLTDDMTVPTNCAVYLDYGTMTIPAEYKMLIDGAFYVSDSQTLNNYGTIEVNGILGIYGTLNNYGTVYIHAADALSLKGTWNGNEYIIGEPESDTMSYEDFLAAMARGYVDLSARVVIEEDLEVTANLYINQGGEIVIPSGVTVVLNRSTWITGGKITVEEGGALISNGHMYVEYGGVLDVSGSFSLGEYYYLFVESGASTVTGVDGSLITLRCDVSTEEDLWAAAALTGYREVQANMNSSIRLTADLVLGNGMELQYNGQSVLSVPSNVTLTLKNQNYCFEGSITVEAGGSLILDGGMIQIGIGKLTIEEGAAFQLISGRVTLNCFQGAEAVGVPNDIIHAMYHAYSFEDLKNAVTEGEQYASYEIEIKAGFTIEENITLPEKAFVAMYTMPEAVCVIIPNGVTLTNCTSVFIYDNSQIWIQAGGTLDNQGYLNAYHDNALVIDGTLLGDQPGDTGGSSNTVDTPEELVAAIESGKQNIDVRGSITLAEDLIIPAGICVTIQENGEIVVPDGVTLTNNGFFNINAGKLTVQAGGAVENMRVMSVDGTITVDPKGSFTFGDNGNMTVQYGSTVTGIDKSEYQLQYIVETEEDLRTGLKLTGYKWVHVSLAKDVTLTANLTIPEKVTLTIGVNWVDENTVTAVLTVPSGKTITNNGNLQISDTMGCMNIKKGGKLVNNGYAYVHGTLDNSGTLTNKSYFTINGTMTNNGTLINDGRLYIYGDLIGNGTITGEGYMDYARPAYTYEELVGWLNADLVPTYIYVWGTLTLEGDITIPEGTQLIMEGSTLIVPSGCTVTVNGELYSQYGGIVTFQEGSTLINNNWIEAYQGTINIFGEYKEAHEDIILMLYPDSAINGVDNRYVYYMVSFNDEASLVAALNKAEQEGYGEASVYVQYRCGVVEVTGNVTVPENVYLQMGYYYGDSMVLKSGAVLTNNGGLYVYEPGTLTVESGAQLVNNGYVEAYEGGILYLGGGIAISAEKTALYGKESLTLSASITPETLSGAKVTWTLTEGSEAYASIKASGSKTTITAADVTDEQTIEVTASATLSNGAEVTDTISITIHPLVKQITIAAEGQDVTGQTIKYDLNHVPDGGTEAQRTLDLTALVMPGKADQQVNWTTSSTAIADVDDNGQVTFTGKDGKVTITATATDGSKVSGKVTIQTVKLVQSITLLSGDTALVGGKSTTLKVQDSSTPGKALATSAVSWALADETDAAYVSVTAAGKVTTKVVQEHVNVLLLGTINDNPYADPIEVKLNIYPAVSAVDIQKDGESVSGETRLLDYSETLTLTAVQFPDIVLGEADWTVTDKKGAVTYTEENNTLTLTPTGKAGTVTIKATATDGSKKTASVTVNVAKFVTGITVETDYEGWNGELTGGESMNLTANVEPEGVTNAAVTWSFEDPNDKNYVTLSSSGKVTAKKGLAMSKDITILATAKDGSGIVGAFTFTLLPSDPGVLTITRDSENVTGMTLPLDLNGDATITLKAEYFEAVEGYAVIWTVKNATILEQTDTTVTIQATKAGTVTVTAADKSNAKKTATVKLTAAYLSSGVKITSKTGFDVASGKTLQLTATVQGDIKVTNTKVNWWIDAADTAYAKISSGKITATKNLVEKQTIKVWAQAADGNSEAVSETVTIHPLVSGIQIINTDTNVELTNTTQVWDMVKDGTTLDLEAGVFPADAVQTVTWKSSSDKIAAIDPGTGMITMKKAGSVTITANATDGSGKKATFKLTVVRTVREITQTKTEAVLASNKTLNMAKLITVDPEATNKMVTWKMTGDTAFATLSASGTLKAKAVTEMKTVTVTATAQDGSGETASITVYIYPATTKVQIVHDGSTTLAVGGSLTLKGISTPSAAAQGANAYTWKTSGADYVAFVRDAEGNVVVGVDGSVTITGLKATGKKTITITCTAADGTSKSATIKIKVG